MVRTNKSRNVYVIAAITLTTLLIVFIFSIGMSFLKSYKVQQIRLMGSKAHVLVTKVTENQVKKLKSLDYVKNVGLMSYVTGVKNTSKMKNMSAALYWYDKSEWEQFRIPANTLRGWGATLKNTMKSWYLFGCLKIWVLKILK